MAVDEKKALDDDYLADKLVEIGSIVAIADNTALEPVSGRKAEWWDYMTADTEDVERTLFAHETAVGSLLGALAYGLDLLCTGAAWPHLPHF